MEKNIEHEMETGVIKGLHGASKCTNDTNLGPQSL